MSGLAGGRSLGRRSLSALGEVLAAADVRAFRRGCPCGWEEPHYDDRRSDRRHAPKHLQWARGVRLRGDARDAAVPVSPDPALLVIGERSPLPVRRAVYEAARLFQREQGFDFVMVDYEGRHWSDPDKLAYLAVHRDRAVALLLLHDRDRYGHLTVRDPGGGIPYDHEGPVRTVQGIWVAVTYRRRGVAKALVREACEREGTEPSRLAWSLPLTEGGEALARSLVPPDAIRVSY
jgi:hypothetical protein